MNASSTEWFELLMKLKALHAFLTQDTPASPAMPAAAAAAVTPDPRTAPALSTK
jgi:hypothetical protein